MYQLHSEQNNAYLVAFSDHYLEGSADAAFSQLPRFTDEEYLAGYLVGLKKLPTNPDGTIQHYTPRSHFAFGQVDLPDACSCDA